ncbi:MAG TPA: glycerol-3-phosphate dehydrogenase/oxidase [Bacteroidales bacterium]|nr:glycerol-3-phosphate dehydrogenase/oxidase [Bacteroidales bacterium]
MNRNELLSRVFQHSSKDWDIIIIGGGATGAGIALDAASRGYDTLLLEQEDFGKGTSSRSTKLIHGGVRYLAQGNISLVLEALMERGLILKNAPHLTFNQQFLVPVYSAWEVLKYTAGLKFYDLLAGKLSLGKSSFIGRDEVLHRMPNLKPEGLKGGVIYHDGQFDDSRLLISIIRLAIEKGCIALNYCKVTHLLKDNNGILNGVVSIEGKTGKELRLGAKVVINATGVFSDEVLRMDMPVINRTIRPSQGIHIVLKREFLDGDTAIMIPKTDDGRVLFIIPWYGQLVAGTTDTPVDDAGLEPKALEHEINFILNTAGRYLIKAPERKDILTVFAGLRPLIARPDDPSSTRELSRSHRISISESGLLSVEGGKWTTYRRMAQDALDRAIKRGMLEKKACVTHSLSITGENNHIDKNDRLRIYGNNMDAIRLLTNEGNGKTIHPLLPYTEAEIIWICRNEMPVKVEDILARRTRALFLNARASIEMAPVVASIMAEEMGFDAEWKKRQVEEYGELVKNYIV